MGRKGEKGNREHNKERSGLGDLQTEGKRIAKGMT